MSAGAVATPLSGLRVAVTGEFTQTREQLQASIERLGGTVVDRVLGRGGAQVLIVGRAPGSKVEAALFTGVRLIGEGGLNAILADAEAAR